ncbi:GNAT family N-acetyltransferase [uncultured Sphingomonas sp.]|uniref:GNAT family N-acetyltransferase n=1 Tax=uncultured Sphingomonas sp. TaxID=158754 RepID=UPI00262FA2B8|nr:GNAT family N-acetyltransferase [uncultured Sphingomonas sp.]
MIEYRPATPADGPALDAMARKIWLETFERFTAPDNIAAYFAEAYGPDGKLIRDLTNPDVAWRIACDRGEIVGYAKLTPPFLPDPAMTQGAAQLSQLYVAGSHHGAGIAQALMAWAADTARAGGATALLLTVFEKNPRAIRFYEKFGFVHIGDYDFPVGDQVDRDLIMRLAL